MRFLSNCLCNYSQIGLFDTKTYRNKVQRLSPTFCNGTAVCPVICSCLGKIFSALHLLKPQPPHLSTLVTFQMFVSIVDLRELPPKTCSFQNQNIAKHLKIHQIYQLLSAHFEVFPQKVVQREVVVLAPRCAPSRAAQASNQRHRLSPEMVGPRSVFVVMKWWGKYMKIDVEKRVLKP